MQQTIRKSVSWLLTLAMIFSMLPGFTFTVLAAEHLCAHHTEHTADCGYEAGVSDCTYHCDICLGHDHGEPAPAAVCTCETDDPDWHAPFCDAYVAPEDPQCYCVEVCGDFVNDYCDVCYFDAAACAASGEEEAALFAATPTYISKIAVAYGEKASTPKDILTNNDFTVIDYDLNRAVVLLPTMSIWATRRPPIPVRPSRVFLSAVVAPLIARIIFIYLPFIY